MGEYFIQLSNDFKSIYSSLDGVQWTKALLPKSNAIYEMQFYTDGTPLIKDEDDDAQMIRRNGSWYTINQSACVVKNDTLFTYYNKTFSYSLDKGAHLTTLFTTTENISNHSAHLWKFNNYLVLHHTAGAGNYVSVFNMSGQRVLYSDIGSGTYANLYNACEQLLFVDYNDYYLLKEEGLALQHGDADLLFPFEADTRDMIAPNGDFYVRKDNIIYKTDGCEFNWEIFAQRNEIEDLNAYWINEGEDLLLWQGFNNFFIEHKSGSGTWDEHRPGINNPFIIDANEAVNKNQLALGPYHLFNKKVDETSWATSSIYNNYYGEAQYAPNGDLYVNADTGILYSKDNGDHFEVITIPDDIFGPSFTMLVLDNDVILIIRDIGQSFLSLNNGKSWSSFPVGNFPNEKQIKLVGNYVYIIDSEFNYIISRRNIITNQAEVVEFKNLYNFSGYQLAIQDDGTIYFYGWDPTSGFPEGIFRFRFGQDIEPLPLLEPMAGRDLYASGSKLFTFTNSSYQVYDGETLQTYGISGLPSATKTKFLIAANEHLMAIINESRIFRSKEPLTNLPDQIKVIHDWVKFELYPNPAHTEIHLTIPDHYLAQVNGYQILDVTGKIWEHGALNGDKVDVAILPQGVYDLILTQNQVIVGQKKFTKF